MEHQAGVQSEVTVPEPLRFNKQASPPSSTRPRARPSAYQPKGLPENHPHRKSSVGLLGSTDRRQVNYEESHPRIQSHVAAITYSPSGSVYSADTPQIRYQFATAENPTSISKLSTGDSKRIIESSSDILGNFVVIASPNNLGSSAEAYNISPQSKQHYARNKYEFETSPLFEDLHRQTRISDFMSSNKGKDIASGNHHDEYSHFRGDQVSSPRPSSLHVPIQTPRGRNLQRSESSPSIIPGRFRVDPYRSPSPDIPRYYYGDYDTPIHTRGRQQEVTSSQRGRGKGPVVLSSDSYDNVHREALRSSKASSVRPERETNLQRDTTQSMNSKTSRYDMRSTNSLSTKHSQANTTAKTSFEYSQHSSDSHMASQDPFITNLKSVTTEDGCSACYSEQDDEDTAYTRYEQQAKKRSRSPMKKMFGEKGWLGRSPNEFHNAQQQAEKENVTEKKQPQTGNTKSSLMSRLKNKLDKVAEKADVNTNKGFNNSNKLPTTKTLAVSLGPPEQARIYMELELMLVHTANAFLMSQFSQGTISIDSIKKTVDTWKSKGRPSVLEFMYDQSTQRDLVSTNQHTFRFHGNRAGDGIRVNSVLYNWKQVASHMSIRTFCNADPIIMKLIFDIGQILELLGAAEGILMRYQNIRLSVNDKVQVARKKKNTEEKFEHGRQLSWDTKHPYEDASMKHESNNAYGGMKHVPESYTEKSP